MTNEKMAELRRLAEAARDSWKLARYGVAWYMPENLSDEFDKEDRGFIAAANPLAVIELLDRIAELERR